jgi:hypothetical protein
MWTAAMQSIANSVTDCVRLAIPQATERQHIGNQNRRRDDHCGGGLGVTRLRSPNWTDFAVIYQRCNGVLPLLGLRRGFDRCYGSFDCLIYGLTNSGLLKRGSSEACDEPKMEINKPIRMRVRVRDWWPPWW